MAARQSLGQRHDLDVVRQIVEVHGLAHEMAVHERHLQRLDARKRLGAGESCLGLVGRGNAREGRDLAQERAQVGVLELLDPAVREAAAG